MHVTVIGAGPAGSLCAFLLARRSIAVTLIEQHRFPRDKVCGECLSALGRDALKRHDLERPLTRAGAIELTRTDLCARSSLTSLPLAQPMLGISRAVLDEILLDHARAAGATLLQPARVEQLETEAQSREKAVPAPAGNVDDPENRWNQSDPTPATDADLHSATGSTPPCRVRLRDLVTNDLRTIDSDYVILADGRGALLGDKPALTGDLGIKAHFANVGAHPGAITLYAVDGCYGGAAPIEGSRWNVAFSVPASLVRQHAGDIAAVFAALARTNPTLQRHFARATRLSDWLAAPLPRYSVRDDWVPGIIPIGNAAAAIEPIGGEGMGLALRSAELAADAIVNGTLDALPGAYRALWRKRQLFCRLGGLILSRPVLADAAIGLLDLTSIPPAPLLSLVGK